MLDVGCLLINAHPPGRLQALELGIGQFGKDPAAKSYLVFLLQGVEHVSSQNDFQLTFLAHATHARRKRSSPGTRLLLIPLWARYAESCFLFGVAHHCRPKC